MVIIFNFFLKNYDNKTNNSFVSNKTDKEMK